jgi:transcriptional regulator with XRE-family HTH domain
MRREPVGRQNGAAIRALREKDKRSPADMARHVGLHPQALRNIENNSKPAGSDTIKAIADILDVPIEAITRDGCPLEDDAPVNETVTEEAPEPDGVAA